MRKMIATLWLAAALLLCGLPALAQDSRELAETLLSIQRAMNEVRADIAEVEAQMADAPNRARREAIGQELTELRTKLARQRRNFETIASGLTLQTAADKSEERLDWQAELKELISPLLKELKQITDRPREIDRLRTEIAAHQTRLQGADKAMARIGEIRANAGNPELQASLDELEMKWREHKEQFLSDIAVSRYQLDQKLSEEQSFAASARTIFESFFKSRGKNLLIAIGSFFLVFFVLRFLHGLIHRRTPMQRMEQESFLLRLFDVLSYMGIVLAASTASLVVLYLSGDWVLLGLTFILLVAIVWSAKEGLRRFWEQGKLILNIGGVRVGERIIWNGLPWRVETIHYYSTLVNPALSGGRIRVQLNDFIDQVSRPLGSEEDWFPSREGDWVMLSDGSYGQVQRQTPEHVRLQLIGGSYKTFQTADYLGQTPRNLSKGFTVGTTFGVDYKHQAIATHEVPDTFRAAVEEGVRRVGLGEMLESVSAEFRAAGASSLDIGVWVTMKDGAGHKFYAIERLMQRVCTETCTAKDWTIPFAQITVHQADRG